MFRLTAVVKPDFISVKKTRSPWPPPHTHLYLEQFQMKQILTPEGQNTNRHSVNYVSVVNAEQKHALGVALFFAQFKFLLELLHPLSTL